MHTTSDILLRERRSPPSAHRPDAPVSTTSCWSCFTWELDATNRRHLPFELTVDWSKFPPDLVPLFKALTWSLMTSRPGRQPIPIKRVRHVTNYLRYLANWMKERKRSSFDQISPAYVEAYVSDLRSHLRERAKERQADYDTAAVAAYLLPLQQAFDQRRLLEVEGFAGLAFEPFGEGSAWALAEEIAPWAESFTPPLPDEVVLPIVSQAHAYLNGPAEDLITLQERVLALEGQVSRRSGASLTQSGVSKNRYQLLQAFCEERPETYWLSDLRSVFSGEIADAAAGGEAAEAPEHAALALRRLFFDVLGACVIVIRFQSGIRHGEILTFEPGLDESTGLPACLEIEDSISGAYEMFFVRGAVEKGRVEPEQARWLLAGRVKGDKTVPDAVRALQLIHRILEPWRARSSDPDAPSHLLLQFLTAGFPQDGADIVPMHAPRLARLMQDFIVRRVDLQTLDRSDEALLPYITSYGRKVQSKQWRKTWANFVFRTNGKLLPAISQQFHHFSTVLTQEAYIGKNPEQLGLLESAATERAVAFMQQSLDGGRGVGGMMRKVVNGLEDLKKLREGLSGAEQEDVTRQWLVERDIKCWSAPHGKCMIGLLPNSSRCHEAGETLDFSNQAPNFLTRNPRLCSGCACFALDEEDMPFWAERYLSNKRIWDEAVSRHMEVHYVVAQERYEQSARLLRSLDIDLEKLEKEYTHAVTSFG